MGFIAAQDGSGDLFVHRSDLLDGQSLVVGSTVCFEPTWDTLKNKACAHKVTGAVPAPPGFGGGLVTTTSKDNLFISNLPGDATEDNIWEVFGQYGQVIGVKLLPENGSPSRVALVRFAEPSQAEWILLNLNGNVPNGMANAVEVKYHESKTKGSFGPATMKGAGPGCAPYGKGKGPAFPAPVKREKLRIIGFPPDTNHQTIRGIMSQYGIVNHVIITPDGAAIVHMSDEETAQWCVDNLNGNIPQGLQGPVTVTLEGGAGAPASSSSPSGFVTGTVKHWVQDRGMGFIAPDLGGEDCFVHQTNLIDGIGLIVGAPVTFMRDWDYQKNKSVAVHVSGAAGGDGVGKGAGKYAEAKAKGKFDGLLQ
jgi:cold shock CspA family protein